MNIYDTREGVRLLMNRAADRALEPLGAIPGGARLGHGARRLQRRRRRVELLPARSRPLARLSLERRRPRRHLRPAPISVLRAGAVERPRSDSQGAAVWPDRQRGQPRRGRQGVLLLPRQHADALVHEISLQVSAGGVSRTSSCSKENRRRTKLDMEYELVDTGIFDQDRYFDVVVEYAKRRAGRFADPHQHHAIAARRRRRSDVLPTLWFRNTWSWGRDRSPAVDLLPAANAGRPDSRRLRTLVAKHWELGEYILYCCRRRRVAVHRERDQLRALVRRRRRRRPTSRTRFMRMWCMANATAVNPAATGTKAAARYDRTIGAGETITLRLAPGGAARRASARSALRRFRRAHDAASRGGR